MHNRIVAAFVIGAAMTISVSAQALQCVPFAREHSGISLRGDAWTWWSAAAGQYDRGQAPRVGAVVVFKKHGSMRHGHVAVVTQVIGARQLMVDHANWGSRRVGGRGKVAKNMAVVDVSLRNDWTEVRVWNLGTHDYGTRVYPTYGFIYPESRDGAIQEASLKGGGRLPSPSAMISDAGYAFVVDPVQAPVRVDVKALEPMRVDVKIPEVRTIEAKATESKPAPEVKPIVEAKAPEGKPVVETKPASAKVEIASRDVKPAAVVPAAPAAQPVSGLTTLASADGILAEDLALAKAVGSGRY